MEREVFSLKGAAKFLGSSNQLVKEILDSGMIKYRRFGRKYYISKRSLLNWVDGGNEAASKTAENTPEEE